MAENLNENGLAPDNVDISRYEIKNPAVSDTEFRVESNIAKMKNPAVLDREYHVLTSKAKLNNIGLSIGEDAGQNLSMFL